MTSVDGCPVTRLGDLVGYQAQQSPNGTAIDAGGGVELNYADLAGKIDRFATALLDIGLSRGTRVAMLTSPSWQQIVVFLAAARIGAIFVGLNPRHKENEIGYVLGDCKPHLLIAQNEIAGKGVESFCRALANEHAVKELLFVGPADDGSTRRSVTELFEDDHGIPGSALDSAVAAVASDDPVAIVYTSGSTGSRKGALLHSKGLLAAFWPDNNDLALKQPINCLNDLPVDHLGGLVERVLPPLLTGGTIIVHERFNARQFLVDAAVKKVTFLQAEVTQWLKCMELEEFETADLSCVQVALYTGAAAPPHMLQRMTEKFPIVATGYGMSETSGAITLGAVDAATTEATVGVPLRGVELMIMQDGRDVDTGQEGTILVRAPQVIDGYFNRPEASAELFDDGWLVTGDRGVIGTDGSLRLVGRTSDMYKSGGYNIYPREVEHAIEAHPDVSHAAVVAVPDPMFQEVGAAFVIAKDKTDLTTETLETFCRTTMANYMVPKLFVIRSQFPWLENGKVDKKALRAAAAAARE